MSSFSIFSSVQTRFCCTLAVLATALGMVSSANAGVFTKGETSYDTLAAATPTNGDTIVVNGDGYLGTLPVYTTDTELTLNGSGKITVLNTDGTALANGFKATTVSGSTTTPHNITLNLENITFDGAVSSSNGGVIYGKNVNLNVADNSSVTLLQ